MGAFKVEVVLHDDELLRFVAKALDGAYDEDARYVALRMCDEIPELDPSHTRA